MASHTTASDPLARIVSTLESSPAMYLADSGLASYPGAPEIRAAIEALVAEQKDVLARAANVIADREQPLPQAAFPISFTAWHDVDLRHVLPRIVAGLERQQPELERLAGTADDAAAAGLAAEALKSTRQHLDVFKTIAAKLQAGLSAAAPSGSASPPAAASAAS